MVSLQAAVAVMALAAPGQTVLLDFYSDRCAPCRAMHPTIAALAKKYPVKQINIDRRPDLKQHYNITGVPCFVMVVDGREVDRVVGGTSFSRLEQMCKAGFARAAKGAAPQLLAQTPDANRRPTWTPAPKRPAPASTPTSRNAADWRLAPPGWMPRARQASADDEQLLAASVRLRIEDPDGHSCGSGTIIDTRKGQALILTCGHIFRDSRGKGRIDVDLFGPGRPQRVAGKLISCDLKRDVALVAVRTPGPVQVARVAPPGYGMSRGDPVVSVGCSNGAQPTARHSRVASLDRYLGPPNIEVDDQPVEGRSGGGLFSREGLVVGVCNAADPGDREGLYAALPLIHALLDEVHLSHIYQSPQQRPGQPSPRGALVAVTPPPMPKHAPRSLQPTVAAELPSRRSAPGAAPRVFLDESSAAVAVDASAGLRVEELAALEEIRRHLREGAEVICVVRPRNNPGAKSEVIMLDQASPEFLEQLAAEARASRSLRQTSLELPRERRPASPGGQPQAY